MENKLPPIGLRPKFVRYNKVFVEVCEAISRYYEAGEPIPIEWVQEYNELLKMVKEYGIRNNRAREELNETNKR